MRNRLGKNEKEEVGQFLRKPVLSRIGFRISGKIKAAIVGETAAPISNVRDPILINLLYQN